MSGNESYDLIIREGIAADTFNADIGNCDGHIVTIYTTGLPGELAPELDPERNFGNDPGL